MSSINHRRDRTDYNNGSDPTTYTLSQGAEKKSRMSCDHTSSSSTTSNHLQLDEGISPSTLSSSTSSSTSTTMPPSTSTSTSLLPRTDLSSQVHTIFNGTSTSTSPHTTWTHATFSPTSTPTDTDMNPTTLSHQLSTGSNMSVDQHTNANTATTVTSSVSSSSNLGSGDHSVIVLDGDDDAEGAGIAYAREDADDSTSDSPAQTDNTQTTAKPTKSRPTITSEELDGKYRLLDYLGSGSYGHVHMAECLKTGKKVAIKKVERAFDNLTNAKRLLREIKILRMLNHQNVIGFRGLLPPTHRDFSDLLIVFEFVDTDLQKLIQSNQHFTNLHIQFFLYQLLCGLKYIHSAQVIHRDLKPANVLVNADCSLKICDFGLSRSTVTSSNKSKPQPGPLPSPPVMHRQVSAGGTVTVVSDDVKNISIGKIIQAPTRLTRQLTKHVVTRWYRAPELILLADKYTTAIDMWSCGCILAELLSMQKEMSPLERMPLFPGKSCFPLSADTPLAYTDQLDQLNVIFDVIGTPSENDISSITSEKARNYLRSLPRKPKINLTKRYKGADAKAVDLLNKLLHFDPTKRYTAQQALEHPYLQEVRDEIENKVYDSAAAVDFDFEDENLSKEAIKALIIDEIVKDTPDWNTRHPPEKVATYTSTSTYTSTTTAPKPPTYPRGSRSSIVKNHTSQPVTTSTSTSTSNSTSNASTSTSASSVADSTQVTPAMNSMSVAHSSH